MKDIKISIITVSFNAVATIEDAILSVGEQKYANTEHIIIDGGSSDGTVDVISQYRHLLTCVVSEPDQGIYDAMNKGIDLATGDVIGFLNADDVYADTEALARVTHAFGQTNIDACYGDVVFVRDDLRTIVRYYRSSRFSLKRLAYGWMPAHPALFLKASLFKKYEYFKTDYQIAADFELVARLFWVHEIRYRYLAEVLVKMRLGGVSTKGVKSNLVLNKEIVRACRENGIDTNLFKVLLKFPLKMMELFVRPS